MEKTESNLSDGGTAAGAGEAVDGSFETLTPERFAELSAQAAKAAELQDRLLRTAADFENFKKRAVRERDEARLLGIELTLRKLLPVVDNFDMAMLAVEQPNVTVDTMKAGIGMIHGQLRGVLSESGVEEIPALGQRFDPALHDAVSETESASVPEGHVAQQLRKGYRLRERLLRPSSVVVARTPAGASAAS